MIELFLVYSHNYFKNNIAITVARFDTCIYCSYNVNVLVSNTINDRMTPKHIEQHTTSAVKVSLETGAKNGAETVFLSRFCHRFQSRKSRPM